jgi:hypothetical protein
MKGVRIKKVNLYWSQDHFLYMYAACSW